MIKNLSEKEYKELADAAEGQTLDAVLCYSVPDEMPTDFSFEDRKEIFLWALTNLLKDGRIRLAKHKTFLEGSVEEQVELFRNALPKTEAEIDDGLWFFDERCPGGAVWVLPDGSLNWT
ncbi:DUF596 domain-containing protein [Salmonella enterica subsp. enterica serovar Senftenberg]|nr:DUF596 domain-containing protein [Salmonella enterica]ECD2237119.1 DUF596 domain-containing protein [Salmonella enterica subsp. enterica serovar Offa]EDH1180195.1 DUF596 domain-containing protein [Salmonella enterica subsp. enterica serovar Enteritidis]EDJ6413278.1 DUF596 domain-containing protein [Salmonella enterica subsp. enterica serovar Senftenberg]EGF4903152.1 DUF596 domain-containing protein [Salmonella enterica subsp. enterica serovar Bredeney]EGF4910680.1 DUF596 domain-containing p